MPILNPRFEDAGALPGEAEHWTLVAVTSLEAVAGFGADPELAWEDFERWFELWRHLEDVTVELAFFDDDGFEAFERGWDNDVFLYELPPAQLEQASLGSENVEDCESGWSNDTFLWGWGDVASVTGIFDGESYEDFEDRWRGNESFLWRWDDVVAAPALVDGGAREVETFDGVWEPAATI